MSHFTTQSGAVVSCDAPDCSCNQPAPRIDLEAEERWFVRLGELWADFEQKDFEADHCPRSEQGPARLARDEARVAWLDEVKAGPR